MKRILTIILSAVILLSFTACSSEPEPEFSLGTVNGSVYENTFIGIGCDLGDEWTYFSDEQIMEQNNVAANLAGEEYRKQMLTASVIYDMFASHSNQVSTIGVNLEKINALTAFNIDSYLEDAVPSIKLGLGNMGFTNITHNIGKVKIGSENFTCLNVNSELGEFKMYQTIVAIKCNGYLACVTFSGDSAEAISSAIECFYLIP